MQGSGGAFGKRKNPQKYVDVKDIYHKKISNFENVEINCKNIITLQRLLGELDIETRFTHNRDALSDLSLGLGLMGTHNREALSDLSLGLGLMGTHNREALSDLSLGLGFVGATVETIQTNLDALEIETRFTHTTNSLGDLALGLGLVGATVETLENNTDNALGDLGLGLGLVGATVETLEERVTSISPHPYA